MADSKSNERTNGIGQQSASESSRQRSAPYPRYTLEQAEKLAKTTFELGARNCDQERVAQAAGYKNVQNGSFVALRATASSFGLIKYDNGYISVTEPWIQAFNSEDAEQLKQARRNAIYQPSLYRQLLNDYSGRQLPKVDRLARELHLTQKYGILKDAATAAAETFLGSAEYAEVVDTRGFLQSENHLETTLEESGTNQPEVTKPDSVDNEKSVQQRPQQELNNQAPSSVIHATDLPSTVEGMDRIEVQLLNGKRAFLFVPVPLPFGEKERLKKYIDLLLEAVPPTPQPQFTVTFPSNAIGTPKVGTGPAIWHTKDTDQSVIVTGYAGQHDDRHFVTIEGSSTGVPLDEIEFDLAKA